MLNISYKIDITYGYKLLGWPGMRKYVGLMCTYNLTTCWTLKFHNCVLKHNLSMKPFQLLQHTMENLMQFTEFIWLTQKVRQME